MTLRRAAPVSPAEGLAEGGQTEAAQPPGRRPQLGEKISEHNGASESERGTCAGNNAPTDGGKPANTSRRWTGQKAPSTDMKRRRQFNHARPRSRLGRRRREARPAKSPDGVAKKKGALARPCREETAVSPAALGPPAMAEMAAPYRERSRQHQPSVTAAVERSGVSSSRPIQTHRRDRSRFQGTAAGSSSPELR